MPAQDPYVGMPDAIRFLMGSNISNVLARETIVVDSPPGIMMASIFSSSLTLRTSVASTWQ